MYVISRRTFTAAASMIAAGLLAACGSDDGNGGITDPPNPKSGVAKLSGTMSADRTLSADTTYTLSGFVQVASGATLTIEPGTKIVGDPDVPGSSLWILRGAKIDAEGTADAPIVFTSGWEPGSRKPGDWGGIIIIGNGVINRTADPIFTEGPTDASQNYAGGTSNDDDSGILKYVRIEFAGYDVSNGGGQELNSLSSYAVGRGTTYDYIQSMAGLDDSFEFFGGAVSLRHAVSYESGDDHFDWSEGYQGHSQFLIAFQSTVLQPAAGAGTVSSDPRGFEGDGCEVEKAGCTYANTPYSMPVWANFTVIGPGPGVFAKTDGNGAVVRRGSGGTFVNGVIARWPGVGISIRDAESEALLGVDSLMVRNVILAENGSNFEPVGTNFGSELDDPANDIQSLADAGSAAALFNSLDPASLDFAPASGSAAASGGLTTFPSVLADRVSGDGIVGTSYIGAIDPAGPKWYEGWTAYNAN